MEINRFNEFMKKFDLPDTIPKNMHVEVDLLSIIEALLDKKDGKLEFRTQSSFLVPPWLYKTEGDSEIIFYLGKNPLKVNIGKESMEVLKNKRPFLRIIKEDKVYTLEVPNMIY